MRRAKIVRMALRTLIVAAVVSTIAFGCANQLILGENHETGVDPAGARPTIVRCGDHNVECWIARSPGATGGREPEAFVLFFVGKAERADRWVSAVAGAWKDKPVEVWGMNYPGCGGSDGPAKLTEVPPTALAAYDALRQVAGARPIYVHAGSFGTTVGLYLAAHRPIAGLVLQNPPPLRQLVLGYYGWWNLWVAAAPIATRIPPDLDSLANGAQISAPAVFISAGDDGIIPARYHRQVIGAYAGPKRVIEMPGAGHDTPLTREAAEAFDQDLDWMWQSSLERAQAHSGDPAKP